MNNLPLRAILLEAEKRKLPLLELIELSGVDLHAIDRYAAHPDTSDEYWESEFRNILPICLDMLKKHDVIPAAKLVAITARKFKRCYCGATYNIPAKLRREWDSYFRITEVIDENGNTHIILSGSKTAELELTGEFDKHSINACIDRITPDEPIYKEK